MWVVDTKYGAYEGDRLKDIAKIITEQEAEDDFGSFPDIIAITFMGKNKETDLTAKKILAFFSYGEELFTHEKEVLESERSYQEECSQLIYERY